MFFLSLSERWGQGHFFIAISNALMSNSAVGHLAAIPALTFTGSTASLQASAPTSGSVSLEPTYQPHLVQLPAQNCCSHQGQHWGFILHGLLFEHFATEKYKVMFVVFLMMSYPIWEGQPELCV